ncbi:MAG: MvaI/BcnI family restriction endonuclease [bacterium]|nr:MvaI/BcnI family restriction endonuclease [bacterium]
MQKRTLTQIKKDLKKISEKGWLKSNRKHNTGIGKTLEDYLNITENNIALPDFGVMELKSQRAGTSSMMTLFTKKPEGITNAEILKRFGYPDPEFPQYKILHQTITNGKKNGQGFHCKVDYKQGRLLILKNRTVLGYYKLDFLLLKATEKIGNGLILVFANCKKEKGHEYFHYTEAWLLKDIDPEQFLKLSKYDIRLGVYRTGKKAGKPHDHGSAFRLTRLSEKTFPLMFKTHKRIL